jgi:hypothetical protein
MAADVAQLESLSFASFHRFSGFGQWDTSL